MKTPFTPFPASDYPVSKDFYENSIGLTVLREFAGGPHQATSYDLVDANMKGHA